MYCSSLAVVLATAGMALAAPIAIPNASFDDHAPGYWQADDEWATDGDGDPVQEILATDIAGKHGANFLQLSLEGGAGSPPTETGYQFSDALGTFQPNTTYTLTVGLSHSYDWSPSDAMKAGFGFATGTTSNSVIASTLYSLRNDGTAGDFVTYNQFSDKTFVLTTGSSGSYLGEPIHVTLMFEHAGQYFRGARFDNVRLDAAAVPEPAFIGVLGVSGLLALRRRPKA